MAPILSFGCAVMFAATCLPGQHPAKPSVRTGPVAEPAAQPPTTQAQTPPAPTPQAPAQDPVPQQPQGPRSPQQTDAPRPETLGPGHLVLVVEGSVRSLRITHAVAKPDPWAGVPQGLTSAFALVAFDAKGSELASVPIDLSKFETDPGKVDAPIVVEGCEVRSPRIGVLLNFPTVPTAVRYEIRRGTDVLGGITAATLGELLQGDRR